MQMDPNDRHIDFTDLPHQKEDPSAGKVDPSAVREGRQGRPQEGSESQPVTEEKLQRKVRVKELIDGTFLVRENMIRQLPYVLFLTFLGVVYIGNRFHAERMVRQINDLKIEVGNLRAEQITITSELMNISRPSEVAAMVESKGLGLKESLEPPKKLKR
jgi:hypothetical protein